jgi:hypothetical protein
MTWRFLPRWAGPDGPPGTGGAMAASGSVSQDAKIAFAVSAARKHAATNKTAFAAQLT